MQKTLRDLPNETFEFPPEGFGGGGEVVGRGKYVKNSKTSTKIFYRLNLFTQYFIFRLLQAQKK